MSTSATVDAAVLDALYGDLPSYQPKSAEGPEVEGEILAFCKCQQALVSPVFCKCQQGSELRLSCLLVQRSQ